MSPNFNTTAILYTCGKLCLPVPAANANGEMYNKLRQLLATRSLAPKPATRAHAAVGRARPPRSPPARHRHDALYSAINIEQAPISYPLRVATERRMP